MNRNKRHTFLSEDGKFIYYVGIIDYLQTYNLRKTGETLLKRLTLSPENKNLISCVPPTLYRERFHQFMSSFVIKNQLKYLPVDDNNADANQDAQEERMDIDWNVLHEEII